MRALTRMRSPAAALALLLFLASSALAGVPNKPIDRSEGPPPNPAEIGDPDTGGNLPMYLRLLVFAVMNEHPSLRGAATAVLRRPSQPGVALRQSLRRGAPR